MRDSLRFLRFYLRWASIAALLLIFPATHAAGLNDTGITTCSNADTNGLPCPVAGFPGQDAEFGTNGFDFTKLDAAGNDLPATATDHTCVRDNVTGLIWEVKTDDDGLRDQDWNYTWYDTNSPDGNTGTASGGSCYQSGRCDTEKFVQDVNSAGLCGFNDWRMPNKKELFGIVDRGRYGPAIDPNYFPHTPSSWFWSGSPIADGADGAWGVDFGNGDAGNGNRDDALLVRLVRGGQ